MLYYQIQGFWTLVYLGFFSVVNWFCFKQFIYFARLNVWNETYFDVFCINNFVEATCLLSGWAWLVYLVVRHP